MMLRITSQSNPAGACAYFEHKTHDYYLEGEELDGQWGGKAARLLGLSGEVKESDFKALAYNRHPDDPTKKLTGRDHANRRVGYDFTFSVPKSVTLAFELNKDDRIMTAFRQAVADTMADIEADVIVRDRRGGKEDEVKSGNLVHATFVHRSSRPVNGIPDCQLHAHAFVFNASSYDGRWSSVELGRVKADAPYYEALFTARLGKSLVDLGYGVRRKGRFFELAGVSDELVDKFSTRKRLIEQVAAERDITNPDYKAELGGKTRERKSEQTLTPVQLRAEWLSRMTDSERAALENLPGQVTPLPSPADAMGYAIRHHFERSSVVPEKRVYEEALRYGVGSVDLDGLKREANRQGLIVKGEQSTTRDALAMEKRLVDFARDGRGTRRPLRASTAKGGEGRLLASRLPPDASSGGAPRADRITLNAGQSTAVKHILSSKDRVVLVRGAAGTGKTTMLKTAVEGMNAPVRAVAVSSTAAEELAREVTPNSSTLARFLLDETMQEEVKGGVVLVDEASLVGTRQMDRLVEVLERIDARTALVGDLRQHSAVEAGSPFRALQQVAKLPVVEVTEVMRQSGLYKEVTARLSKGETDTAIDLLDQMGWVKEGDEPERMRELVGDYLEAVHKERSVIVVCPTHAEGEAVTAHIRDALKAEGKLGDERQFTRLVPLNLTEAQRADAGAGVDGVGLLVRGDRRHKAGMRIPIAELVGTGIEPSRWAAYQSRDIRLGAGDSVRITANGKDKSGKHKLLNGSTYTVKAFTRGGDIVLSNGWTLPKDYGHLTHGYVTTSHASQGKTVDTVLVAESSRSFGAASMEQLYVSLSRGKRHAYLYTDSLDDLKEAVSRERGQSNAHDLLDDQFVDANKMVNRVKVVSLAQARLKGIARKVRQFAKSFGKHKQRERKYGYDVG